MRMLPHYELSPFIFTGLVTSSSMMPSKLLVGCWWLTSIGTLFLTSSKSFKLIIKISPTWHKRLTFIFSFCVNLLFNITFFNQNLASFQDFIFRMLESVPWDQNLPLLCKILDKHCYIGGRRSYKMRLKIKLFEIELLGYSCEWRWQTTSSIKHMSTTTRVQIKAN